MKKREVWLRRTESAPLRRLVPGEGQAGRRAAGDLCGTVLPPQRVVVEAAEFTLGVDNQDRPCRDTNRAARG